MKKLTTLFICALPILAMAQETTSPDGNLKVNVSCKDGNAVYSVSFNGETVINESSLGLNTTIGDFTKDLKLDGVSGKVHVGETYSMPNAKKSSISYDANEQTYSFSQNGQKAFDIVMHVDNNNIACKYIM